MNLLLLNQFYAPDPAPTGQFLRDLAQTLVARGHHVAVICSSRAYEGNTHYAPRETLDGVDVHRVKNSHWGRATATGRILDYLSFFAAASARARSLRPRPDFTLSLTTPPYIGLVGSRLAPSQPPGSEPPGGLVPPEAEFSASSIQHGSTPPHHGHWLMDLYPDVLAAHGMLRESSIAYRALASLTRRELRGSALTVVLGDEMVTRASRYSPAVRALPLWGPPSLHPWPAGTYPALRAARGWAPDELVLMYSGNMGLGHRLKEFLAAAEALQNNPSSQCPTPNDVPKIRWVFAGGGQRRAEVESFQKKFPRARVELLPGVSSDDLREHLCSADLHLASLDSAWQGCMVPSKVQGIFAVGRPVLFVGGNDNSAARWITESGGGWVVPPNDVPALLRAIAEARPTAERTCRGTAAAAYARTHFNRETNCNQLCTWIESTANV